MGRPDAIEWTGATAVRAPLNEAKLLREPSASAWTALGKLEPGLRLVGLTRGQFSLLDLIRAVLAQTGPADVTLSTWTSGIRDAETSAWLLSEGKIRSLRLMLDYGFPRIEPSYALRLAELFGDRAVLLCRTHAKFAVIRNDAWSVCIRSSMNLNRNTRFEQFDLDDDSAICDLFETFADDVARATPAGFVIEWQDAARALVTALSDADADADADAADLVDPDAVDVESMLAELDVEATLAELGVVNVDQLVKEAFKYE